MKFAIDAMGGDHAPLEIVKATVQAAETFHQDDFILYGDKEAIEETKKVIGLDDFPSNIMIEHCSQKIETGDEPVKAVRKKKDSSIVKGARAVKNGKADAVLSAGNTGALLTAGTLIIGRLKGIERPALLVSLPSVSNPGKNFAYIDAGANADSKPKHIWQYALMGSAYYTKMHGTANPRVGLLNNGSEEGKGNEVTKEAFTLLKAEKRIHFVGNVEARDLLDDVSDVVVCDGFTGNAVLKAIEGTASAVLGLIKDGLLNSGWAAKIGAGLIARPLKKQVKSLNFEGAGAGLLFGVKAPVLKCHGNAQQEEIYQGLVEMRKVVASDLYGELAILFRNINQEEKAQAEEEEQS